MIFVTGSAGFIASNFILNYLENYDEKVLGIDSLTYASNIPLLEDLKKNDKFLFYKLDINNSLEIEELLYTYKPNKIINFAAESHVDKSISNPDSFIKSNIVGTYNLLKCARKYQSECFSINSKDFIFLHISTDEVFGSLEPEEASSTELSQYKPNSPYAASKAASDHIVRSFNQTFNLNTITTNCSNNYGPYQFPEKLIPLIINNCLLETSLPIYGDGLSVRDWIYVEDHCNALISIMENGKIGESYNIGGENQISNIELVKHICILLDKKKPSSNLKTYQDLIKFVPDRLAHDRRYSIDIAKIKEHTGWKPKKNLTIGVSETVDWYLANLDWLENIKNNDFEKWIKDQYQ